MYEILFSRTAERQLKKLEKKVQGRIIAVLERARVRPESFFQKIVGEKAFRLRAGDYRIIADIENEKLLILVLKVAHRKKVYKK